MWYCVYYERLSSQRATAPSPTDLSPRALNIPILLKHFETLQNHHEPEPAKELTVTHPRRLSAHATRNDAKVEMPAGREMLGNRRAEFKWPAAGWATFEFWKRVSIWFKVDPSQVFNYERLRKTTSGSLEHIRCKSRLGRLGLPRLAGGLGNSGEVVLPARNPRSSVRIRVEEQSAFEHPDRPS
jgi:hypothetical protein